MSQRKLDVVKRREGGLATVKTRAKSLGVHLAIFVDDHGDELVVASRHPIKVIC